MSQNVNFLMVSDGFSATKQFRCKNGSWKLDKDYNAGKFFKGFDIPVLSLYNFYEIMEQNQEYPVFFIHGEFIDGINKKKMIRRTRENKKDNLPPTLKNRNINLFCLDIDGYEGDHDIDKFIVDHLPDQFHKADYVYQYSSSYGLTSNTLKCHIFFWLKESAYNIDIRNWIKEYNKLKEWSNIIDPAVLNPAQPVYTQKRICIGAIDPVENFLGYVKKEGNLDFTFERVEVEEKEKIVPKKTDYDLKSGIEKILNAENYHDELRSLALSLINKKVPAYTVKEMLQGAMNAAEVKDERWQSRYDDIERTVDTATDIVDNPTIEEILNWIYSEDTLTVKADYARKVLHLSPMDRTTAIASICSKIGYGVQDVKKTIKIAEEEDKLKKIEAAREQKSKERESRGIYEIEVLTTNSGDVAKISSDIVAKSKKKPEVFIMSDFLCSIDLAKPKTIRQALKSDDLGIDYPKMPIISQYRKPFYTLAARLEKDIVFINESGIDIECPTRVLHIIGEGSNENLKPLTGIVEHPFIDNNWKLVRKQGYDKRTGLFTFLHHKLKLTKMEPKVAFDFLINEVLAEFPFEKKIDKIVAVAALMTAIQRPTISGDSGFPGFGIVSPTQSSGKTTLAQLISYSIFNRPVAAATLPENDEEELAKALLAILQEGHSCVLFDNISQGTQVTSNNLAKVMSSDSFRGRQLGENRTVEVPCSVLWLFTGNGIKFVGDFSTRIYPININPKMADPNTRVFKRENIGQWALDNRKKIISAVLSIIIDGKSIKTNQGTRFKEWDKFVRQPLLKVSGVDINDAIKNNQLNDPVQLAKTNFLIELEKEFGDEKFTTKDILKCAFNGFDLDESTPLGDSMEELFGDKKRKTQSIGMFLSSMIGEVAGDLCLQKINSNITKWYLKKIN